MIQIGQVLNDTYEIHNRLGSGGGGIIYKAYHRRMRKYVAIKLIKDSVKGELRSRAEVDVLKNLKNDYLPQVIDFVEDGSDVYTVMEYIEGLNFKQYIQDGRSFSEAQVRKYALQLCSAVKYLHNHVPPIIHSDIKPANIMLTPQDNICLIDFNISLLADNGTADAKGGSQFFGAPEQFKRLINAPTEIDEFHEETRFISGTDETEMLFDDDDDYPPSRMKTKNTGKAYVDVRTDIYGIGTSLYFILTGRVPQEGRPDFRGIRVSSQMCDIIAKAMNPDPKARYRNVSELEAALGGGKKTISNKGIIAVASCVVAASLLGIAVIMLIDKHDESIAVSDEPTEIAEPVTNEEIHDPISEDIPQFPVNDDNNSSEEVNEAEADDVTEEIYGVLSYYENGKPHCEKSKLGTGYTLLWYDPDGTENKLEYYNSDNELYKVDTEISGEWHSSELDITATGYILTVQKTGEYPYNKFVVNTENDERHTEKVIYCDKDKNELFFRTYRDEYYDDGSKKLTWREEDGSLHQIQYIAADKSKTVEFYKNNKLYQTKELDPDGNVINVEYNKDNIVTAAAVTTVQTESTTVPAEKIEQITIKGVSYSVSLKELDLQKMDLNDSDIEQLAYMTNLEVLWLNDNNISDLTPLSGLTKMTELHLGNNRISNVKPLAKLTNLKKLGLKYNQISDISSLSGLINVTDLSLNCNDLTDISALSSLTNLERLWIYNNRISNISPLKKCTKMIQLNIENNNISDISALSGMSEMYFLYMSENPISDITALSKMSKLSTLDISSTKVKDISVLAKMKKLKHLAIYDIKAPSNEIETLKGELSKCEFYTNSDYRDKLGLSEYR